MQVLIKANYREMSQVAARIVAREILLKERLVLGLPTGDTPAEMYEELVQLYNHGLIDFSKVITFNLDEYYGLSPNHPQSYHHYMRERLLNHVNIHKKNIYIPNGIAIDIGKECKRYEEEIHHHGGIDLQVLGIGPNGHIGFNEPGSGWGTVTRLVTLLEETRKRESKHFSNPNKVPTKAITMGIKTIMNAKKILLLASGKEKAKALKEAFEGPITTKVPASILQLHPNVIAVIDSAAGVLLENLRP